MNKRTVLLICVALVLAGAYYRFFMDGHKKPGIQIFCEKSRASMMGNNASPSLIFHFPSAYDLTSVEVVNADDARTNKYPHPLWHMIAPDKPAKTTSFTYGEAIPGMKPEIATAVPEPLQPGEYTLMVEAGKKLKGAINFKTF
jgi:hypothetical protein